MQPHSGIGGVGLICGIFHFVVVVAAEGGGLFVGLIEVDVAVEAEDEVVSYGGSVVL